MRDDLDPLLSRGESVKARRRSTSELAFAVALGLGLAGCRGQPAPDVEPGPELIGSALAAEDRAAPIAAERGEPTLANDPSAVHGTLRTIRGQRVLHVWGTAQEMGYAHGFLLRDDILAVIDGYALDAIPKGVFSTAAASLAKAGMIDEPLREEARGVLAGLLAAGGAESRGLGRTLTVDDILLVNTLTDLVAIGCSSVSAWGSATSAEPGLEGELAVVRNLDWAPDPALLGSQLLIAYEPSDPQQQPVLSIAFAGYLGCLSCINESGVTGLFNMGYCDGVASLAEAASGFAPANLLLRSAMSARDVDGDGAATTDDVIRRLEHSRHAGSYIVHLAEPMKRARASARPPARVVEVEAEGVGVRSAGEDSKLGGQVLAATNHLRVREAPRACSRYRRIEQTVRASGHELSLESLWELGESVRIEDSVVHTMMIVPETRAVSLRLRAVGATMGASPPRVEHQWREIFGDRPAVASTPSG